MARVSRNNIKFDDSSIVIVCEGTETENKYLEKLVNESHFTEYKIVPNEREIVDKKAKRNRGKIIEKKLQAGDTKSFLGPEYYVGLPEVDQNTYDFYKSEPLRWVRAAQLYMERFNYAEGWAVYDLDNKTGGRTEESHEKAYNHAVCNNINIALSAYSIEEWFLVHFERNPKAFQDSECTHKINNKKEKIGCGSNGCTHTNNCHGQTCIGGYLREKKYIIDYDKGNGDDYVDITQKNLHRACVNAAWTRSLNPNLPPYQCNPYTDVDKLVLRLLGKDYTIRWIHTEEEFKFDSSKLRIHLDNELILECKSATGVKVVPDTIYWCDDNYESIGLATVLKQSALCTDKNPIIIANKPAGKAILCIKSDNQEFYFEID